jgi:cysteine desulfurase
MVYDFPETGRIYLDEASDTPLLPEALEETRRWLELVGDPARAYLEGIRARRAVEAARQDVAELVESSPRNIVFCSSATEGLNWLVRAALASSSTVLVSAVEHSAVTVPLQRLSKRFGCEPTVVPVTPTGKVDPDVFEEVLREAVSRAYGGRPGKVAVFCFVQHANHELGTLQPIEHLSEIAKRYGARLICDASMTVGRMPVSMKALGVSALVFSAHKFGGPKGAAAVALAGGLRPEPLLLGSAQERGRRAGPEDVAAICGMAAACRRVMEDLEAEERRQRELTAYLIDSATSAIESIRAIGERSDRAPHIAAFELARVQGEALVLALDKRGFAVHSGSACAAEGFEPSPVLEAVGVDSRRNLRVSLGRTTTRGQIEAFLAVLHEEVRRLERLATSFSAGGPTAAGKPPVGKRSTSAAE